MKYYFVTTKHLKDSVWFRDEDDFKVGMNAVALIASLTGVTVLAFVLMSNHVHFLIRCWPMDVDYFINELKRHYSRYVRNKYGIKESLRRNGFQIQEVDTEGESLEKIIAYIQMNPVAAGICLYPNQYRWGTGKCFFSEDPFTGDPFGGLNRLRQKKLVHSKKQVPDNYLVCKEHYILPESYVDIESVEKIFRTPKRMAYFQNTSSKIKQKLDMEETVSPHFQDQVVLSALGDLMLALFRKDSLSSLNDAEKGELLRQIKYRFSSNIHQMARVIGLEYDEVVRLLDQA